MKLDSPKNRKYYYHWVCDATNMIICTFSYFKFGFTAFLDMYRDGQVVLAGDPKQLGPVIISVSAKSSGLGQSMLARFINYPSYLRDPILFSEHNGYNPKLITHLIRNYRSLPQIVQTYSAFFYNSLLLATVNNKNSVKII